MDSPLDERQAKRRVTQMEEIADSMRALAEGELSEAIGGIEAAWGGEASDLFLRHCYETRRRIVARSAEMHKQAQQIREAINRAERAGSGGVEP